MIGEISQNYPDSVKEFVNTTMFVLNSDGLLVDTDPTVLEDILCNVALHKFLGSGEMYWDEGELYNHLCLSEIQTQINHLKELGLVDSIEDEHGEEVLWATEKGKDILKQIADNNVTN